MKVALLLTLAGASALDVTQALSAGEETISTIPMYMYKKDCHKKRRIAHSLAQIAAVKVNDSNPGAGFGKIEPYGEVLKDGFFEVACVKDYLLEHGDALGKNKFA